MAHRRNRQKSRKCVLHFANGENKEVRLLGKSKSQRSLKVIYANDDKVSYVALKRLDSYEFI